MKHLICAAVLCGLVFSSAAGLAAETHSGTKAKVRPVIRLYASAKGETRYFTGDDWMLFTSGQKVQIVEKARTGAVRLNAVMSLPAEVYVRELDRIFGGNPGARHIELGQAIQGAAIGLKDWDDGTDPDQQIKALTGGSGQPSS